MLKCMVKKNIYSIQLKTVTFSFNGVFYRCIIEYNFCLFKLVRISNNQPWFTFIYLFIYLFIHLLIFSPTFINHHFLKLSKCPAPVASSADHICFTSPTTCFSCWSISCLVASPYNDMARLSPWVVRSCDHISTLPVIIKIDELR